jgi:oxygen-independent coproporphyrinogen-3 oxidase
MRKEIEFKALELDKFAKNNNEYFKVDTIYIGGGTPSFIKEEYIIMLVNDVKKYFVVDKECEITTEVNPDSASLEKLIGYKKVGINRISIGLQTTEDELLKEIGRIHNYEQFKESYNNVKCAGFSNINVDLMIGLPNQKLKNIEKSLRRSYKIRA